MLASSLIVGAWALSAEIQAATLATYAFTGNTTSATQSAAGITAGNVTNAGLSDFYVTSDGYSSAPVLHVNPASGATTAPADGSGFPVASYFSITLDSAQLLNIDAVSFNAARGGTSEPRGFVLRSSVTGNQNLYQSDVTEVRATFGSYSYNFGTEFQNINGPVTFEFYIYTPGIGASIEFDNITFTGSVVPEPRRMILLSLAGVWVAFRRRNGES